MAVAIVILLTTIIFALIIFYSCNFTHVGMGYFDNQFDGILEDMNRWTGERRAIALCYVLLFLLRRVVFVISVVYW